MRINKSSRSVWLYLSLGIPLYYGLISLHHALSHSYIIQDDARQHIVWFQQLVDPQLFPNDEIANYFQTVAPAGVKFVYGIVAKLGVDPLLGAKLLPILLGIVATLYFFKLTLLLLPVPTGAFLATLIFNQQIWLNDDLISATPRAFLYPLFAAFLYYLVRRSLIPCLITIALLGLFYLPIMLLAVAVLVLRLFDWQGAFPKFSRTRNNYILGGLGLILASITALPFALNLSELGSAITVEQMRSMPEFYLGGRSEYFGVNSIQFVFGGNSGLRIPTFPTIILLGFALPLLLKSRSPLVQQINRQNTAVLLHVTLASLGMFLLAHLLLLRLHYPNRYTYHSFIFVLSIAAGIVLSVLLDTGWRWWQRKRQTKVQWSRQNLILLGLAGLFAVTVVVVPAIPSLFFNFQGWVIGNNPAIYRYLATQPKETLVASLAQEANNIPAFSQRSILVGREFALSHHPTYYATIRERATDLVRAQYSPNLSNFKYVIEKYGLDFVLIERTAFKPEYLSKQDWLVHSSFQSLVLKIIEQLQQGVKPALVPLVSQCSTVSANDLVLLEAECIRSEAGLRQQNEP
jgi:hypothetical protein